MSKRTRLALGLTGGYLLGRYRKTRWLLAGVVAVAAGRQLGQSVARRGGAVMESSPELHKLAEQGRETAVSLLGDQIRELTSRVHAANETLRQATPGEQPEQPEQREKSGEQPEQPEAQPGQPAGKQPEQPEQPEQREKSGEQPEQPEGQPEEQRPGRPAAEVGQREAEPPRTQMSETETVWRARIRGRPEALGSARRRR